MKRKLLFMMLCIVGALSMRAQVSLDITDLYITNAGFETGSTSGWTVGSSSDTGARSTSNATYAMTNSEGNYLFNTWWQGIPITQNIGTLPAGTYNLSAVVASDGATVYMTVNDNHDTFTETTSSGVGIEISHEFTLTEDAEVTIGIIGGGQGTAGEHKDYVEGGYWWYKCDNFKLTLQVDGEIPAAIVEKLLSNVPEGKMSDKAQSNLTSAVETFRNSATMDNYEAALQAISAANTSIASYQIIADGAVPTNSIGGWAISTVAGELACNTWSTEGNSDGSGMTTPFVQDWAASGTALGVGKLYYTLEGLNPGEKYNVNARVRVFNESAGSLEGGSFFVGDESLSISDEGTACSGDFSNKGMYGVLTLTGEVNSNGILQFGIDIASGSELNWISIKDVTISEFSGYVPTSIELDNTSLSLTIGSSATITAIVEPEEADDKTLSWTSSDSSVATVSDGVVTAVGAGTATITATANAATSVTATCNVTVENAPAPAVYSEISEGKFLVINAATGKYLGAANAWGTAASLTDHGVMMTVQLSDGAYKLTDIVTASSGLGSNCFTDNGTPVGLTAEKQENGAYTLAYDGKLLSAAAGTTTLSYANVNASSPLAQWYFISEDDAKKLLANASETNPVDVTYYALDPNFGRNNGYYGKWTFEASNKNNAGDVTNFCVESYHAVFSMSQELNVPNGVYKVKAQGFYRQDGNDNENLPYFFANDEKQTFPVRTGSENTMNAASSSFLAGLYFCEPITVTVTDHKLTIGAKNESNTSLWCIWDNFSIEMIDYTPVTSIEATIDNDEIEEGNTAQITATVTPENASFDKVTYTSSDESIATIDENGQVTAVAEGEVTITVAAEMEDVSATVDVTVVKPAVLPETIAVYNGEEEVTELEISEPVTLTAVVGPEGAAQTVTFVSDNEEVVTVDANGTVTPVLPGTANITVASAVNAEVAKTVSVTVAFDETEIPEVTYVNDGPKRTYSSLGENIIKNGAFEYPDAFYNWTQAKDFTTKITSAKFSVAEEDGNKYLVGTVNEGAGGEGSLGVAWPIEAGKSYVFSYRVKNLNAADGNHQFLVTSLTNAKGTETKVLGTPSVNKGQWATVKYAFTNDEEYQFLQIKFRWLSNQFGFDDFYLCEASSTEVGNVDYITENVPTSNIGTNVFQYNQDNIDAATGLTQATPDNQYAGATVEAVEAAYERMMTLNEPNANSRYYLVVATEGHALKGNAVLVSLGATGANNPTGYSFNAKDFTPNQNLAQTWTFVPVDGKLNTYNLYYTDEDSEPVYLTYGSLNGSAAGWKAQQIQGTKVHDNAGEFEILSTSTDNVINIRNTVYNATSYNGTIACQAGGPLYTEAGNADFTVQLAEPAVIEVAIAEGAYATRMFPFKPEIPSGVVCYEVEEMNGTSLVLKEVSDPQANTPYILYSEEAEIGEDVEGYGTATSLEPVEKGLLVGTLADENTVPAGNYVLQTLTNGQKFYKVASDITNYPAYRAYLKGSEVGDGVKEIGFADDDTPTGINAISEGGFNFSNIEGVYDLSGAKIGRLQKGTNVVRMKDGSVRKVLVK